MTIPLRAVFATLATFLFVVSPSGASTPSAPVQVCGAGLHAIDEASALVPKGGALGTASLLLRQAAISSCAVALRGGAADAASTTGQEPLGAAALPQVDDDHFFSEVEQAHGPVVVFFYTRWCGACQAMMPTVEQAAADHPGVKALAADVSDGSLAEREGVRSIPMLYRYENGAYAGQLIPPYNRTSIEQVFDHGN